jgi:hypothetical protein
MNKSRKQIIDQFRSFKMFGGKRVMKKSLSLLLFSIILLSCSSNSGASTTTGVIVSKSSPFIAKADDNTAAIVNKSSPNVKDFGLDVQDRKIMEKTSPRTVERMDRAEPLTIGDIIKLSQGGVSDDTIIKYMHDTKTTYNLSQSQINRLQEAGVSQRVINHMIDTGK